MSQINYRQLIENADVYSVVKETPIEHAACLTTHLGNKILLKREDLHSIYSFKIRGAVNKLNQLSEEELKNGVICSSAGNHGQGVALAAQQKNIRAVIVMPLTTPSIKVAAVRSLVGEVILYGDNYDEAHVHAKQLENEFGLSFIHPYDDPYIIAGQGTIGIEILNQTDEKVDAIFIPIGGGGLISGIGCYIKETNPDIKIIGVEPTNACAMKNSIDAGYPVTLEHVGNFADGVAVKKVGDETFKLCEKYVDEIITVNTDEISASIQDIYEDTRVIVEPSGALAVAGLKRFVEATDIHDQTLVAINSGANVNFDRLGYITERAAIGKQREMLLAAVIPEEPGSFRKFCKAIGPRKITEFNYRYNDDTYARVFVGVELQGNVQERKEVMGAIEKLHYTVVDLSDNEMVKQHIRHMVGGSSSIKNEKLFRFEFPEKPGALLDFLNAIGTKWNISLFHYRNHGSDYGRVLCGIQVPNKKEDQLTEHLSKLGYSYWEESKNPAYEMFLTR
jgi:threonine dehydratase